MEENAHGNQTSIHTHRDVRLRECRYVNGYNLIQVKLGGVSY